MKRLHRPGLYCWSRFDEARNLDFNSVLWVRDGGNVAIDPLPLSPHERERLMKWGGVATIVITNSDHVRATSDLAEATGAKVYGPAAERESFPIRCDGWLETGDTPVPGLRVIALEGSKTPGELALVLDGTTLVCGDLVRGHQAGKLNLLPKDKLRDPARAAASVRRLLDLPDIDAVIVGDGWSVFRDARGALRELADALAEG